MKQRSAKETIKEFDTSKSTPKEPTDAKPNPKQDAKADPKLDPKVDDGGAARPATDGEIDDSPLTPNTTTAPTPDGAADNTALQPKTFDTDGYDEAGYDQNGYDRNGHNQYGYDANGYNADGYNEAGYNQFGYDADGYNADGYNADGVHYAPAYDADGYDLRGYDESGNEANDKGATEPVDRADEAPQQNRAPGPDPKAAPKADQANDGRAIESDVDTDAFDFPTVSHDEGDPGIGIDLSPEPTQMPDVADLTPTTETAAEQPGAGRVESAEDDFGAGSLGSHAEPDLTTTRTFEIGLTPTAEPPAADPFEFEVFEATATTGDFAPVAEPTDDADNDEADLIDD